MVGLLGRTRSRSTRRPSTAHQQHGAHEGKHRRGPSNGRRSALGGRSVAGQVFVLQVAVVLLLVVAAVVALVLQVRHDSTQEARGPLTGRGARPSRTRPAPARRSAPPTPRAVLQPSAEAARKASKVDFIVVLNTDGIRYTHPKPDRIGKKFVGTIGARPRRARPSPSRSTGPSGRSSRPSVPIKAPDGKVVGLVSAGITTANVGGVADRQLPLLLGAAAVALALATAGTALVSRRLLRQTHGLGPAEMTRMYEHHDAVLHAVREGRDHRRRRGAAAARQRRGAPAARPARRRRGPVRRGPRPRRRDRRAAGLRPGRRPTRSIWSATGCWPSTSAPRTATAARRAASPRCGTPPSCGRSPAGRRRPAERLKLLYDAGVGIGTHSGRGPHRRGAGGGRGAALRRLRHRRPGRRRAQRRGPGRPAAPGCAARPPPASARTPRSTRSASSSASSRPRRRPTACAPARPSWSPTCRTPRAGWTRTRPRATKIVEYGIHSLITVPLRVGPRRHAGRGELLAVAETGALRRRGPVPRRGTGRPRRGLHRQRPPLHARAHHGGHPAAQPAAPRPARAERPGRSPTATCPLRRASAATGSTSSRCPAPGSRWWWATSSGTGCTPRPPWGGCARPSTTSPRWTCRPTSSSATWTSWSAGSTRTSCAEGGTAGVTGATCLYAIYDPATRQLHHGPGRASAARAGAPGRHGGVRRGAGRPAARPRRAAVRDGGAGTARGQPARALHGRAGGGPGAGTSTTAWRCCARALAGAGPRPRRRPARPCSTRCCRPGRATTSRCSWPAPGRSARTGSPSGTCPPSPPRWREVRCGRHPEAGAVGAGGDGLHHGADPQRTGHQRHPLRRRAHRRAAALRPRR